MSRGDEADRHAAHVFVDDVEVPVLGPGDRHHLVHVLRVRPGEVVTASDGAGRWCPCRLATSGELEVSGETVEVDAPRPALTVGVALTKAGRPEMAVQKLTELGVERIVPFVASRSVTRWEGERGERHLHRLRRVAREAAMQSRRVYLPEVDSTTDFATVAAGAGSGVALAHSGGAPPSLAWPVVLVGPEGGWAPEELDRELPTIGLGPQVLRAETAAIAAATLMVALRDGLVRPVVQATSPGGGREWWASGPPPEKS